MSAAIWTPTYTIPLDAALWDVWSCYNQNPIEPISLMWKAAMSCKCKPETPAMITLLKNGRPKLYLYNYDNARAYFKYLEFIQQFPAQSMGIELTIQHGITREEDIEYDRRLGRYVNTSNFRPYHDAYEFTYGGWLMLKANVSISSGWGDPEEEEVPNYCGIGPNNIAYWRDGLWYVKSNPPPPPPPTPTITCYPDGTPLPF